MGINLSSLAEQLLNGITVGSFYALIALGYTMVYGVLTMINFAHSEFFMVGSYVGLFALTRMVNAGWYETSPVVTVFLSFLAGMAGAGLTGITVERLAYRPLRRAARLAPLISAIGVSFVLQEFVRLLPTMMSALVGIRIGGNFLIPQAIQKSVVGIFESFGGSKPKAYPGVLPSDGFEVFGLYITYSRILVVVISILVMVGLYLLVQYSKMGKAMRAVSEDKDTSALMGINVDQIISRTFLIGAALAGLAGVMMGMYYLQIKVNMGFIPGIKAFTAAVMGGIGSIPGAMLGGYFLGIVESVSVQFLPSVYKDVVAFSLLILTLVIRPTGFLSARLSQKKM